MSEQANQRALYVLVFATFTSFVGFSNIMPLLPLYVLSLGVESLNEAALWTGIILGISPLISAFTAPFWGMVADRYGHKRIIQRSLFGFSVLFIPMAFTTAIWQLVALRALFGVLGGFTAQTMALASTLAPRRHLARAIGTVQLAQVLGTAIGPLIGGVVSDRYGFQGAILSGAVLNGVAAIAVTVYLHETRRQPEAAAETRPPMSVLLALAGFVPMLAALLIIRLVERVSDPLIPLLVVRLDPNTTSAGSIAGLIISLGTLATAGSALLAGRLGDRSQGARLLQGGLLIGTAICVAFIFAASVWQILGLRLVLGLAVGGAMTLALAFAGQNVPPERRGAAFGLLGSATMYGNALGGLGTGALASLSFEFPFLAAAGLYLVCATVVGIAVRQRAKGPATVSVPAPPAG